jgi:hypothetical protein
MEPDNLRNEELPDFRLQTNYIAAVSILFNKTLRPLAFCLIGAHIG